eukprot:1161392-Pelagomonas_calceolata.AAC.14
MYTHASTYTRTYTQVHVCANCAATCEEYKLISKVWQAWSCSMPAESKNSLLMASGLHISHVKLPWTQGTAKSKYMVAAIAESKHGNVREAQHNRMEPLGCYIQTQSFKKHVEQALCMSSLVILMSSKALFRIGRVASAYSHVACVYDYPTKLLRQA